MEGVVYTLYVDFLDIDECGDGTHNCDINAACTNLDGSFNCICVSGYMWNGTYCEGKCEYNLVSDFYLFSEKKLIHKKFPFNISHL